MKFTVSATCGAARRGRLTLARGVVNTPAFMPVGTYGAVRAVSAQDLRELKAEIILANAFHLMLRPGDARIQELGGLHAFAGWQAPILTDSGGFQAFSLAKGKGIGRTRAGIAISHRRRFGALGAGALHAGAGAVGKRRAYGARRMHGLSGWPR